MKKLIVISFLSCFLLFGCEKENKSAKNLLQVQSTEIQTLYRELPEIDYGNITTISGNILCFENMEHYESVLSNLNHLCEMWNEVFISNYGAFDDDSLMLMVDSLAFDEYLPLSLFEQRFMIYGSNLRAVSEQNLSNWAQRGSDVQPPIDSIINNPIEQTLFTRHYEICIEDTIYQLRENGVKIQIPVSDIDIYEKIRSLDLKTLEEKYEDYIVKGTKGACYNYYYFNQNWRVDPTDSKRNFSWSYKYSKALMGHKYKLSATMNNYRLRNGQWKKCFVENCSLGAFAKNYMYDYDDLICSDNGGLTITSKDPQKKMSISKSLYSYPVNTKIDSSFCIIIGDSLLIIYPKKIETESLRNNPEESYVVCTYKNKKYKFNVENFNETILN